MLNLTETEKKRILEDIANIRDLFIKLRYENCFSHLDQSSKNRIYSQIEVQRKNLNEIQELHNTLVKIVETSEGHTHSKLTNPLGTEFYISAHQTILLHLQAYAAHFEVLFSLLDNFVDYEKVNQKLSEPKKLRPFLGNTMKSAIITEYTNGKLFHGTDGNLRNAIAHFDFHITPEGPDAIISYQDSSNNTVNLRLGEFMLKHKRLNISVTALWYHLMEHEVTSPA